MKLVAVGVLAGVQVWAQAARPYMITTFAGKGPVTFTQENASPTSVLLMRPERVAWDLSGNLYVSDSYYHKVFKVLPTGSTITLAGSGTAGFSGDGAAAKSGRLNSPTGVAVDSAGNVYIADTGNHAVRKVDTSGIITTLAGTGAPGADGDGGPAASARLFRPAGLAADSNGNLYIADEGNHAIRKVDAAGVISTVAGCRKAGAGGDGGPAVSSCLNAPRGVTLDASGNLYIADTGNHKVRKVAAVTSVISTMAGSGEAGWSGDGGPASSARLSSPEDVGVDSRLNIYIADCGNHVLRKIAPNGIITTAAGTGVAGDAGDGGYTYDAKFVAPAGLVLDNAYNLYVVDRGARRVRRMYTGYLYAAVGTGSVRTTGDNGRATAAQLLTPSGLAFDSTGALYVADRDDNRVRRVSSTGIITSYTGTGVYGYSAEKTAAASTLLAGPRSVALGGSGFVYVGEAYTVLRSDEGGLMRVVLGTGVEGDLGEDTRVAADSADNVYIADTSHHRIRRVSAAGVVTTIAGTGEAGFSGDGGAATSAKLDSPAGLALDAKGNLYVADCGNHRVRRIGTDGKISTVAGTGRAATSGDGGKATAAGLNAPAGLALDASGNLLIAERGGSVLRRIAADGTISTIAGTGQAGYSGDGGPSTEAMLNAPEAVAVDSRGDIYIADTGNSRVRRLEPAQIFTTSVVNAASYTGTSIAPGELVAIFGLDIGPTTQANTTVSSAGLIDKYVGKTIVYFDSTPAPILYSTRGQVGAIAPYALSGKTSTQVHIEYDGKSTNTVPVAVSPSAPGIFTLTANGRGQGAILNQDYSVNSAGNPAARGSVVQVYATGAGQTSPGGTDGRVLRSGTLPKPTQTVTATIGGVAATVLYAGGAYNLVSGVVQVNVRIPDSVTPGSAVPIVIRVGNNSSQPDVTLAVK